MLRVTSDRLAVGLLFTAIGVLACLAPAQGDTWWLLRAGQEIWQTGRVPVADTWSWTIAGRYWPNHEWLTEAIFYALWRVGGMPLVAALGALLILGAWTLSWRLAHGMWELRFLLFTAALTTATVSWALRPQLFTMACLALTATLLVVGRWRWLPLVFVVWTQLHGAVVLGLVAIVGAILAEVWQRRRPPTSLVFVLVACGAASLASPLRLDLWLFVFEWMERSRVNHIVDWLPPGFGPNLWVFWGVAGALPVLAFRARRSLNDRDARLIAIALVLLPVALRAVRNVPMFLLIAVPAVVVAASAGRPVPQPRTVRDNFRLNAGLLAVTIAIGASLVGVLWSLPIPRLGWTPVSPSAAQAIRACPEPMYNTFEPGGALLWFVPDRRVFIDNRQDPYPADLLQASRTVEISGEYESLFAEFEIRCAVVPPNMPTAARLAADPGWTSTFVDRELQVFVRATDPTN